MPWAYSTFGCVAQSLHATQWVRFVDGGVTLTYLAPKSESCEAKAASRDVGVKSLQSVVAWSATSKPSAS